MRIGIDFDNTVICYDAVFNTVASEKGMIPETLPRGKTFVRDFLRKENREDEWTWLQGYVYGKRLERAMPYPGVENFFQWCRSRGISCRIISHKTKYPYSGERYDLRKAAGKWIQEHGFCDPYFFESTKEDKAQRVLEQGCDMFVDDLPEFLEMLPEGRPKTKILFDPLKKAAGTLEKPDPHKKGLTVVHSWDQMLSIVKSML